MFVSNNWSQTAKAQVTSSILSDKEVLQLFTENVKQKQNIKYPIWRAYAYSDRSGEYRVALTESFDKVQKGDTLHLKIKAFFFKLSADTMIKIREVYDYAEPEGEISMWFMTKYCRFSDIDGDGLIDPVIIYRSEQDWDAAFRVNILVYYKNKKYAIRHHDCIWDDCRFTQIDKEFYGLPKALQEYVKELIRRMEANGHAYFGHWEESMMSKKAEF